MASTAAELERPVVISGAHPEAISCFVKTEQRHEDQVQELGIHGHPRPRLGNPVAVGLEPVARLGTDEAQAARTWAEHRQEDLPPSLAGRGDEWTRVELGVNGHESGDSSGIAAWRSPGEGRGGRERGLLAERLRLGASTRAQGCS